MELDHMLITDHLLGKVHEVEFLCHRGERKQQEREGEHNLHRPLHGHSRSIVVCLQAAARTRARTHIYIYTHTCSDQSNIYSTM